VCIYSIFSQTKTGRGRVIMFLGRLCDHRLLEEPILIPHPQPYPKPHFFFLHQPIPLPTTTHQPTTQHPPPLINPSTHHSTTPPPLHYHSTNPLSPTLNPTQTQRSWYNPSRMRVLAGTSIPNPTSSLFTNPFPHHSTPTTTPPPLHYHSSNPLTPTQTSTLNPHNPQLV
jgi:hypothetical protein